MTARLPFRLVLPLFLAFACPAQSPGTTAVTGVRFWTLSDTTRVVIETTTDFQFRQDRVPNPDRLFFDITDAYVRLPKKGERTFPVHDSRLKQIRVADTMPGVARIVFDLEDGVAFTSS